MVSHFTWSRSHSMAYNALHDIHTTHKTLHPLTLSTILPLAHTALAVLVSLFFIKFNNQTPAPGLCTYCFLFLEHSSPNIYFLWVSIQMSFDSLYKITLAACLPQYSLYLLPSFIFSPLQLPLSNIWYTNVFCCF